MTAHKSSVQAATQRCHRWLCFYFPSLLLITQYYKSHFCRISIFQPVAVKFPIKVVFPSKHIIQRRFQSTSVYKITVIILLFALQRWLREILLNYFALEKKITHFPPDEMIFRAFEVCFAIIVNNPPAQRYCFSL